MNHKTFMSLLEKNRGDIIRTIKAEVLNSFMPDFYGTYEIYLNEEDGQIWVLQVDYDKTYQKTKRKQIKADLQRTIPELFG